MKNICRKTIARIKKHKRVLIILLLCGLFVFLAPTLWFNISTRSSRYAADNINHVPAHDVAIVFGAGVYPDGMLTPYLENRVETAIQLYKAQKVKKIVMSGDNSTLKYNEPVAMGKYAEEHGVYGEDVILDYAGFNTYDTCYRAKHIFSINDAIVVTQDYHLPRAVVTCKGLGIRTDGVAAVRKGRDFTVSYLLREVVSTNKATFQLLIKPQPTVLGEKEDIWRQ